VSGGRRARRAGVGERLEGAGDSAAVGSVQGDGDGPGGAVEVFRVQVAHDGARYSLGRPLGVGALDSEASALKPSGRSTICGPLHCRHGRGPR
jgi:hypothetical protein